MLVRIATVRCASSTRPRGLRATRSNPEASHWGALERDRALARLQDVLRLGVKVDQDRDVAARLLEACGSRPTEALDALELLIDRGSDEWFVHGASDLIEAILTKTLPNPACAARVREIACRFVARGHATDHERFLTMP